MLLQLVKRDLAWKIAVVLAIVVPLALQATSLGQPLTAAAAVAPLFFLCALAARPQQRATLFEAALPIPARELFLARLLALMALVWLPLFTAGLSAYATTRTDWSSRLLECGLLLTLMVLLPLSARVPEFSGPIWTVAAVWIACIAAGAPAVRFLSPAAVVAGCALADVAVFLKTWFAIPPAFQTAPLEAVAPRSFYFRRVKPAPVWWTFARSAFPWFVPINILLVLLTQYAQGCLEYSFCISMVVYAPIRLRMQWLEALPVPRRAFLLAALVPVVLPVAIGAAFTVAGRDVVSAAPRSGTRSVQVPLEYWRHAPGGVAPVVTAPWGETFRPKPETFLRYPLYNPYAVGPETSARFVEWQYRRAREAVSGHPFTKARMRVLYVAAVLALSLGFLWLVELQFKFGSSNVFRALALIASVAAIFLPALFDVMHNSHSSRTAVTALLRWLLLRVAARLPDNLAVVVAVAAIPVLPMLRLLDRQIRKSEQSWTPPERHT